MRVFLADLRIVNDSVDNCGKSISRMLDKVDEVTASEYRDVWLLLIKYDQEIRLDEKNVPCDQDLPR